MASGKRDRLGRGLGALLGEYLGDESAARQAPSRPIPVSAIVPNRFQPRREFSDQELEDLAASMRENGLLQPIVVRPVPDGGSSRWELVAGERRWRSAIRLGWREIPAIVKVVDDRTMLVLALVENLQRSGLSPLEEADGFRRLAEEFSLNQLQIAEVVGRDRSTVANALRLLHLPTPVRRLLEEGGLSAGHARALLGVDDERRMIELARQAAEQGWSVREVEAAVQRAKPAKKEGKKEAARDAAERALEEELQRVLGTDVKIRRGRGTKGRIEVPFYDADDFERVFELLARRSVAEIVS